MQPAHSRRTIIEPFKFRVVEPLPLPVRAERERVLREAGCNLFLVPSRFVTFDFLTDSGTTAMSAAQWGAMMVSDESYAGSRSFEKFEETVRALTGYRYVIPTHQGRAAERLLFSHMELVRMAFPRRVYTQSHFDYILEGMAELAARKADLRGMRITYEPPFLRHFTARFEPLR